MTDRPKIEDFEDEDGYVDFEEFDFAHTVWLDSFSTQLGEPVPELRNKITCWMQPAPEFNLEELLEDLA